MSETDSFIDEVTDELRRDRLYATFRRWAPIGVIAILLIVSGTAWNEWRKAQREAEAAARGDALAAAIEGGDPAAIVAASDGPIGALLAGEAGDLDALRTLAVDPDAAPLYRDLAAIRLALAGLPEEELRPLLGSAAAPGAPYRPLAEEQLAYLDLAVGETDAALARLTALVQDADAGAGLRSRAAQAIVALGGAPDDL